MKKITIIGFIILVFSALVLMRVLSPKSGQSSNIGPSSGRGGSGGQKSAVSVVTKDVIRTHIVQKREFTGSIKPSYSYVIAAKVSGRLLTLSKRIGDKVATNEAIGRIDDTEYRQALNEANAQVAISKASVAESDAQLSFAQRESGRINELVAKGITSQADLDLNQTSLASQKSRYDLALAQLAQREAALSQVKTKLEYSILRSSQNGYVAIRHTDGGALLSINSPVLTIIGIDTVYVEISVTEKDYSYIASGQKAMISVEAIPEKTFTGTITATAPMFQTATRTAVVEIAVVNDSLKLKPGMFARIDVILAEKDSAQIIPVSAIVTRNGKTAVFVEGDSGVARLVPVTIGVVDGDNVEVITEIPGKKVITTGNHLLSDGSKILTGSKKLPIEKDSKNDKSNMKKTTDKTAKEVK